jgi:hypothetical protein
MLFFQSSETLRPNFSIATKDSALRLYTLSPVETGPRKATPLEKQVRSEEPNGKSSKRLALILTVML